MIRTISTLGERKMAKAAVKAKKAPAKKAAAKKPAAKKPAARKRKAA
jgi:DNA topoisomerase-1